MIKAHEVGEFMEQPKANLNPLGSNQEQSARYRRIVYILYGVESRRSEAKKTWSRTALAE